jgi:predicted alpha/beta superfamily hydrolase
MHTLTMRCPGFVQVVAWAVVALVACVARGQVATPGRVDVTFSVTQTTSVGQSVFVLGDRPELGGGVMSRAVKLTPTAYPLWRGTISLPAGATYTYRFVTRADGPGQTSLATNGTFVSAPVTATAPSLAATPSDVPSKVLALTWGVPRPAMFWRAGGSSGAFTRVDLTDFGPSPNRTGERVWLAWGFMAAAPAGSAYEFYFTAQDGTSLRYPATGTYSTTLDGAWVQDGQQYTYVPASNPGAARRDYNPASVPTIVSPQLGNAARGYRVFLPRGYDQHSMRRYPVLYMHDGQNVFESGSFGSWNAAPTLTNLQALAQMREVIVVGLDNGPNRLTDYLPPTDILTGIGRGDAYLSYIRDTVKPLIDSTYRTIPDASVTGIMGSSMGGVISLYGVWDFTSTFTRGGLLSGAWQTCPNYLNRVRSTPSRAVRMYIDSGDSGTANDGYWPSYNLRDYFVDQAPSRYSLEGSLRHDDGFGQQHNESSWAQRLPAALAFLYPPSDGRNEILGELFGSQWDVDRDGDVDGDDLATQGAAFPQGSRDLNLDGTVNSADAQTLERHLRRDEARGMAGQR